MKVITWNVNGIRAVLKKGFLDFLRDEDPDIVCLQETKAMKEQVEESFDGYHTFWCSAKRKGYSGTAIFSKHEPLAVTYGLGVEEHDDEGRVVCLEFEKAYVLTVYTPNAKADLSRLLYRTSEWDQAFLSYANALSAKKPVVFCGDLNVAHKEIDLANPKANVGCPGFTMEERQSFDNMIKAGFVDAFRNFDASPGRYTWWSYRAGARERNVGWRIDYFMLSPSLVPLALSCEILDRVLGSDHCPVSIRFEKTAILGGA